MSLRNRLAGIAVVVLVCFTAVYVEAAMVAQTGFNATSGVNPSDYANGVTISGKGTGEPGWTNTWTMANPAHVAYYNAVSSPKSEGDLGMKIHTVPGSSTVLATREFTNQTGVFYVDTMAQATSTLGSIGWIMYTLRAAGGTGTMINLSPGGVINVSDQTTDGNYVFENTGQTWTAGHWVRFTQEIDVPNQTYKAWINGKPYEPADPLNFRNNSATSLDKVQMFLWQQSNSSQAIGIDELRFMTHNPLTACASTGFEVQDGYVAGDVIGQGDGEFGWTSPWRYNSGRNHGTAIVQSAVKLSGDMALEMMSNTDIMIEREYEDQNTSFRLDFDVMIPGALQGDLHLYAGNDQGTGFNICFDNTRDILARDGNGSGGGPLENTGFDWTAGQWTHVTARVDVESQTYDLWIDGSQYIPLDPLGFRNTIDYVDDFRILLLNQTPSGSPVYFDNLMFNVPEPTSWALLAPALLGLLFLKRRRSTGS